MRVLGVDFTCAPRRAKPIVVAVCSFRKGVLEVESVEKLFNFNSFATFLLQPGPWLGGFDFPFGLPSELVRDLGWPRRWRALVELCGDLTRAEFRGILDGYRATRPAGKKYAHRKTDLPAGSSSPMKLVNPPVALMFHEGAPRLIDAGVHVPGLLEGDRKRVALEAYPGLLARSIIGRVSYKNDTKLKQTPERRRAQADRGKSEDQDEKQPQKDVDRGCQRRFARRSPLRNPGRGGDEETRLRNSRGRRLRGLDHLGMTLFLKGLGFGFILAATVGPMWVLCFRRTVAQGALATLFD